MHATHCPCAGPPGVPQTFPPGELQVPATAVWTTLPLLQESWWHAAGVGTLVSSGIIFVPPLPSQTAWRQVPWVCIASGIPAATAFVPQQPAGEQVAATHSFPVGGQSFGCAHVDPPQTIPEELLELPFDELLVAGPALLLLAELTPEPPVDALPPAPLDAPPAPVLDARLVLLVIVLVVALEPLAAAPPDPAPA